MTLHLFARTRKMFEIYILPAEQAEKETTTHGYQAVRDACDSCARTHLARKHESVRYPGLAPLRRGVHHLRENMRAPDRPVLYLRGTRDKYSSSAIH